MQNNQLTGVLPENWFAFPVLRNLCVPIPSNLQLYVHIVLCQIFGQQSAYWRTSSRLELLSKFPVPITFPLFILNHTNHPFNLQQGIRLARQSRASVRFKFLSMVQYFILIILAHRSLRGNQLTGVLPGSWSTFPKLLYLFVPSFFQQSLLVN